MLLRWVPSIVASNLLGRTNQAFPSVWLSLSAALAESEPSDLGRLVGAALESGLPIDISSQAALWGGYLRGTDSTLAALSTTTFENATDEKNASDLVQAHLIETLSAIGREHLDFYFLRVRHAFEESQISGALQAVEMARQEGHIRFVGICCDGPAFATLGLWQFNDAFEVLLVPRNHYDTDAYDTLAPLARERRVGIVTSRPLNWGYGLPFTSLPAHWRLRNLTQSFYGLTLAQAAIADLAEEHPVLVGVRSEAEVIKAAEAVSKPRPDGLRAMLQPFIESFEDEDQWAELLKSDKPVERAAAERRQKVLA